MQSGSRQMPKASQQLFCVLAIQNLPILGNWLTVMVQIWNCGMSSKVYTKCHPLKPLKISKLNLNHFASKMETTGTSMYHNFCPLWMSLPLNQVLNNSEKVTKILRTLPESFDSLAMASSSNKNTFEEIINAVKANIERKKKIGTWK